MNCVSCGGKMQGDYCCTCGKTAYQSELLVLLKEFNELYKLDLMCEQKGEVDKETGEILQEKSKMVKYFEENSPFPEHPLYNASCEKWCKQSLEPKLKRYLEVWQKIEELGGKADVET